MDRPVFLDPTGRRLGRLRVAGRIAGAGLAGYLLLVVVSLVAPPGLDRLQVPGVGGVIPAQRAPEVVTSDGDEAGAADAVDDARRAGSPPIAGPATGQDDGPNPSNGGAVPGSPVPPPPQPTPLPTSTPVKGKPSASPGRSGSSPGHSSAKPTSKPKPTPKPNSTSKPGKGRSPQPAPGIAAAGRIGP
ncbi:MAG TPA: hypothetical protein VMZ00_17620 [Sporichthya sp.]|nr:hypothetical protein [Sporichthya sp.]